MKIRQAKSCDIDEIMKIFSVARDFMRRSGNKNQWINGYPQRELILRDIKNGCFFVIEDDEGKIRAGFSFIIGEEETYKLIEGGAWKDQTRYGTIHRIASDGTIKGVMPAAVRFCQSKIPHIRADTHADNAVMRRQLEKCGFEMRGIIYVEPGNPRLAFEISERKEEQMQS